MIEVALFGAGRIGAIHAGNLARQPGVKLKYVADVNRPAAVDLAVKHRAEVRAADAIFADESITAIIIASSTDTHAELLQRGDAAGKGYRYLRGLVEELA